MPETVGAWFRRMRLRAGYRTQADLAGALGVVRAAVANWESGSVAGRPSRTILPQLARLLGISTDELGARFGIDAGHPVAAPPLDPAVLAAIEEAVARGVARGVREALAAGAAPRRAPRAAKDPRAARDPR